MSKRLDDRVRFDDDRRIADIDLSNITFENSTQVNAFYDMVEQKIAETGEELWFFLINFSGFRIEEAAWYAHHKRGKALNLSHSMGTVRVDASDETRRQIERTAKTEAFDPNLCADRDTALARIAAFPSKRKAKRVLRPTITEADVAPRISFDEGLEAMEIDLSNLTIQHSGDVAVLFDQLEHRIAATEMKWFFLINMENCRIYDEAWVAYAQRGKALNITWSLGTVRYNTGSATEETIRMRAESQSFRPNVRDTRDAALARLAEMKAEMA